MQAARAGGRHRAPEHTAAKTGQGTAGQGRQSRRAGQGRAGQGRALLHWNRLVFPFFGSYSEHKLPRNQTRIVGKGSL